MSDNKKTLWMVAAGVGALVGMALLYHAMSGDSDGGADGIDPAALKAAGIEEVLREGAQLEKRYFLKLLQFIGEQTRESTKATRDTIAATRRKHFSNNDWDNYEVEVRKAIELEDKAAQQVLQQVTEALGISEEEFALTHRVLAQNDETAQFVMAAQQGKLKPQNAEKKVTLTKEKTLAALDDHMQATMKQMQEMKNQGMPEGGDQMEQMVKMMVQQVKLQDDLFMKHKIENEEFEDNLMHYVSHDPQVAQTMQRYMMQMQMSMGMGGGMGGPPMGGMGGPMG